VHRGNGFHLVDAQSGRDLGSFQGRDAELSPDGRSVAFIRDRDDATGNPVRTTLYVAASDGSGVHPLLTLRSRELNLVFDHPVWAPDRKSVFVEDDDSFSGCCAELRRIGVDGRNEVVTRERWNPLEALAVSPSGGELAFAVGSTLETLDLHSRKRHRVPTPEADSFSDIAWSPDGKRLAYSIMPHTQEENRLDLYVADADGSDPKLVSPRGEAVGGWDWRPAR
jgi:Tol biopolymer transport system component